MKKSIRIEAELDGTGYLVREYDDHGFRGQTAFNCLHDALTFIRGFFYGVRILDEHNDPGLPSG